MSVEDFQTFMSADPQLKAFGNIVNQVNLFQLDSDHRTFHQQRPNRVALVIVSG
jgi:hypothetical protein